MEEFRNAHTCLVGNQNGRYCYGDVDIGGRITLKCILKK
jgi:hypothetical protein